MRSALLAVFLAGSLRGQFGLFHSETYFQPIHRLSGIGVDRKDVSDAVLIKRTELMTEAQTFSIMRDSHALEGARRITGPKLQKIFDAAAKQSGLPAGLIAAVAYLESWGDANAQSSAGPKGIMQFSQATAKRTGLEIVYATRYRLVKTKARVKVRGRMVNRTVSTKVPYQVLLRDDRLLPERAIPAAANYLAGMEQKFGSRDLALFAYHCGEGCVAEFIQLAQRTAGLRDQPVSVPRLFFSASPAHYPEVYDRIKYHMGRDYSPTYFFRVTRAQQLLELYKGDPEAFTTLVEQYRNSGDPARRASHRLAAWLKPQDLQYQSCEDLKREEGKSLARVLDKPRFFGFQLRTSGAGAIGGWDLKNQNYYLQASPSAIGTLTYVAFETRRLFDELKPKGEKFVPLEVTALVRPLEYREKAAPGELPLHCTGQVFDLSFDFLPPHEKECLNFVLEDMGFDGYLGFVEESAGSMHVGCSPSSREFFIQVYEETLGQKHAS